MKSKNLMWMSAIALPAALCVYFGATASPADGTFGGANGQTSFGVFNPA
jgi:hypothetical protein